MLSRLSTSEPRGLVGHSSCVTLDYLAGEGRNILAPPSLALASMTLRLVDNSRRISSRHCTLLTTQTLMLAMERDDDQLPKAVWRRHYFVVDP